MNEIGYYTLLWKRDELGNVLIRPDYNSYWQYLEPNTVPIETIMEWTEEDERIFCLEQEEARLDFKRIEKWRAEYSSKWPNYCRNCGGWGYNEWTEPHGERMSEDCGVCVCKDKCPRCFQTVGWFDDGVLCGHENCTHCGFKLNKDSGIAFHD
jgi:hypothetical protein